MCLRGGCSLLLGWDQLETNHGIGNFGYIGCGVYRETCRVKEIYLERLFFGVDRSRF